jgi:CTP synthase
MIMARSDHPVDDDLREKIALFCDVEKRAVVPMVTKEVLYEIPIILEKAGVAQYLLERFGLEARRQPDWTAWEGLVAEIHRVKRVVNVALVGKYVELHDAYMSVREAVNHAALALGIEVEIAWVHSAELEKGRGWEAVRNADGIIVPGGFGGRGIEGKIQAARYARENRVPYLGLCLGMQLMVVEFSRYVLGDEEVNSTEFDRSTHHPVIDLMPDQRDIADMGGTMRLGLYPCRLQAGTRAAEAYQKDLINERHRHRFEFNNAYREVLQEHGMRLSGISPDGRLVEIAELEDHPFMLGTQFHPEFLSRPNRPHPLFMAFLKAVRERAGLFESPEVEAVAARTAIEEYSQVGRNGEKEREAAE